MAKNTVEIVVDADTKKAERELGGFRKTLGGLGDIAKNALGVGLGMGLASLPGMIANAGQAVAGFVMDAAELQSVRNTFNKLADSIDTTADVLLTKMKEATSGMIADADLMQAANKFVAMGLADTAEGAAEMAKVATQLGSAMGEDATASMENFALMMANQSIPRLDSFGISSGKVRERIEELMESTEGMTREAAFNQAVMEQAAITMQKVGDQSGGTRASIDRIKATFTNLKDTLGAALIPAFEQVLGVFSTMISDNGPKLQDIIQKAGAAFSEWVKDILPKVVAWFRDEFVPTIRDQVIPTALQIIAWIREDAIPWIKDKLIPAVKDLIDWFKQTWQTFSETYEKLKTTIEQLKFIAEHFGELGRIIVDSLKRGVENAWEGFKSWLTDRFRALIDSVKSALGIASPSRIFAGIGNEMMAGLAAGIGGGLEMPITAAVTAGNMAAQAARAGAERHDHWNLTINTQATAENVAYSYNTMRAMAGA